VSIDKKNLTKLLDSAFEGGSLPGKLHMEVLDGRKARWANIRDYYRKTLKGLVNRDDILLFYYSGHGGISKGGNQEFHLHHDEYSTYRFTVEDDMRALKARLNIVLYDCCSNFAQPRKELSADDAARLPRPSGKKANTKLFKQLFYDSKNWVVVASSKAGTPSYCDNKTLGGFFTWSLVEALTLDVDAFGDKDSPVTWDALLKKVGKETTRIEDRQKPEPIFVNEYQEHEHYVELRNKSSETIDVRVRHYGFDNTAAYHQDAKGFLKSIGWTKLTVPAGKTVRLERNGKPLRVYAYQFVGVGRDSGAKWTWSTDEKAGDQEATYPIVINPGVSYNSGREGTTIKTHTHNLNP